MLKKWKKLAVNPKSNYNAGRSKSKMGFLKRSLSFADVISSFGAAAVSGVPKGFLAVSVGEEMKRFVIPTVYLGHRAFSVLLREAEEEFGFQQVGVLRIPCEVATFESTLKIVGGKKKKKKEEEEETHCCILLQGQDGASPTRPRSQNADDRDCCSI